MTSARARVLAGMLLAAVASVVFWRTAYPTITWWDSSNYSLAAATLGITNAPGSLLLTLLGWLVLRVPTGLTPAHTLNLLAGLLAALTTLLVCVVALQVLRTTAGATAEPEPAPLSTPDARFPIPLALPSHERRVTNPYAVPLGAALGALTFGFSATLWEHAVKFTPYVLTVVFTGCMLLVMLRWWEHADTANAWRWLALLGLLFGLDFSVHRTNALLMPAVLVWILIRHPRTLLQPRPWIAGGAGLAAGLLVHLLIIPIAAFTRSPLNMFDPSNWSRFWDYVSLAQFGGGFMVDVWERKSAFWSVQVADVVRALGNSFAHGRPLPLVGALPLIAAVAGLVVLWRRNRRLALALAAVITLHAVLTVLYFNIPANFFRSLDRHYLPVFVTIGVLIACALATACAYVDTLVRRLPAWGIAGALGVLLVPAAQLAGNWALQDASRRYFARDYAANSLHGLPPNAILFTVGDNDSFPLWYLQAVEGVRADVVVMNLGLANADWYVERLTRQQPTLPVSRTAEPREARGGTRRRDSTIVVPVVGTVEDLGMAPESVVPDSVVLHPGPSFGEHLLPSDVMLVDLVQTNAFRRPLAFSTTAGSIPPWLASYARLEGTYRRIMPVARPVFDVDILRRNLLGHYEYRGYADPSVRLDDVTKRMGMLYYEAVDALLDAEEARGATDRCRETRDRLLALLPPERIGVPDDQQRTLRRRCD